MEADTPVLTGNLSVISQNGFSISKLSKKKGSNLKYCLLFKSSRHGIERLEICENENDTKNARIITLENCVKITQEAAPANLISIVTKTGQIVLSTATEDDSKLWTKSLQAVAFRENAGTLNRNSVIEENDLYCSSFNEGKFTVTLVATDISIKNNMEPKQHTLVLTSSEIQLKNYDDESVIVAKWPYRYIRKYGYRDGKFTFEAGRKCDTGEGNFKIDHMNPQEIFRCMSAKMKSMKKLINGESMNSLDCGENQLNAALQMEAGSRSPLPPSINSPNSPDTEISSSQHSHASLRGFLNSTDSINFSVLLPPVPSKTGNTSTTSIIPNISNTINSILNKPNKPPRKTIQIVNSTEKISVGAECLVSLDTPPPPPERNKKMSERDYECIENITDAWKTLGIDDVKHTEHVTTPEDELKEFVWQRSKSQKSKELQITLVDINGNNNTVSNCNVSNNKVEILSGDDESDYDRLDFFASKHKVTSGYKTIVPIFPPPQKKKPPVSDDYEVIASPTTPTKISSFEMSLINLPDTNRERPADDSYLGYGVLRSLPQTASNSFNSTSSTAILLTDDEMLDHTKFNGLDYAVISKPKRV